MYREGEVFKIIQERLDNTDTEIKLAYNIHRLLAEAVPEDLRGECKFRYLEDTVKDFGLDIKKYKIYSYPRAGMEVFNIIYPRANIRELERVGIDFINIYRFVEIDCNLIQIPTTEFVKMRAINLEHFKKAIKMAAKGVTAVEYETNVYVEYGN